MLIVAQMWGEHDDELFLHKLSTLLNTVKTCINLFVYYELSILTYEFLL